MKNMTGGLMLLAVLASVRPGYAQGPVVIEPEPQTQVTQKKSLSAVLGWTGIITAAVGGAMMVPWPSETGQENYNIYGDDVCIINDTYNNRFDVYDGTCRTTEPMVKAGLITMGVGVGLAFIGFHKVSVAPQVSRDVRGVKLAVKW